MSMLQVICILIVTCLSNLVGHIGYFSADKFEFGELFGSTATIIIIIGFVLLAISFFGSCGACCGVKCMLLLYSVILIVLVLAQIVFVVFLFGYPETLKKATRKPLKSLLKNFRGLNGTNIESVGWNFIMYEFGCCGLDNSDDFKQGDSSWFGEDDADWKTPVACCETLPTTSNDFSCAKANGNNMLYNNYKWGCVNEVWSVLIEDNMPYTYIGAGGILAFQLLMIVFALVLYCKDDENQVSPMEQNSRKKGKRNPRSSW